MPLDANTHYAALVSIRNLEVDMRLRLSQLFMVVNVGLGAAAGTIATSNRFNELTDMFYMVSVGGALSCVVLFLLVVQTTRWMNFWHSKIKKMEETNSASLYTFDDEYSKTREQGPPIYMTVIVLTIVFMILWTVAIIFSIWRLPV